MTAKRKNRKYDVWDKTRGVCAHCGNPANGVNMTIDHFVPRSLGGTFDRRNLMPLCKDCNKERKSDYIDPRKYYKYASEEAIKDCYKYWQDMKKKTRTLSDVDRDAHREKKSRRVD